MRVTFIEVGPLKWGEVYKNMPYHVVTMACEDGNFAMCFIGEKFRNWFKWGPLEAGKSFSNARVLREAGKGKPRLIDADSPVDLWTGPLCKIISKKKSKPPDPQGQLFT
jgi:hypothetical protein